jgi:hypothetical protein
LAFKNSIINKSHGWSASEYWLRYSPKYEEGFKKFGTWGVYTTHENLIVQHLTTKAIMKLLSDFDIQWFEQFDFKTMNQNPARTFLHCIAKKCKIRGLK